MISASGGGSKEITLYFIEKKADLNCQDKEGKTPLMTAIYSGYPELAKLLIDSGADVSSLPGTHKKSSSEKLLLFTIGWSDQFLRFLLYLSGSHNLSIGRV